MKKLIENKSISSLLNNDKAVKIIVAVGFAVIFLILLSDLFSFGTGDNPETYSTEIRQSADDYARRLEEQLTEILSQIQGVGNVTVMVTLEAYDEKNLPKVRGAAVVCEGGGDIHIRQKVTETVSKVLGISTARVSVVY